MHDTETERFYKAGVKAGFAGQAALAFSDPASAQALRYARGYKDGRELRKNGTDGMKSPKKKG